MLGITGALRIIPSLPDSAARKEGGRKLLTRQSLVWFMMDWKTRKGWVRLPSRGESNSCLRKTYCKGGILWQAYLHLQWRLCIFDDPQRITVHSKQVGECKCKRSTKEVTCYNTILLLWVRGHCEVRGNIETDKLR